MYILEMIMTNPDKNLFFQDTELFNMEATRQELAERMEKFKDHLQDGQITFGRELYEDERGWHRKTHFYGFLTLEVAEEFFKDGYFSESEQRVVSLAWNKANNIRSIANIFKDTEFVKTMLDCEGNICFKWPDGHCDPMSDCPASIERRMSSKVIPIQVVA